jgi:TP901 family phage tail tape measure protein
MARGNIYAGKAVILIKAQDSVASGLASVESKLKKASNRMASIGSTMFRTGFFASIGQGFLLQRFAKFDDLMLTLRVRMGLLGKVTAEQEKGFKSLEKTIRSLGKTTSFTTQEVAEGAIKLAQAGFGDTAIEDLLQSVLDLARGTGTDLDNAARTLANTMATFSLDTKTATEVVSQFVKATRMGTLEIDDLDQSLKYASSTATELGQTLPLVLAIFTKLSQRGMRGSIAGTSFNTTLTQIAKKSEDISKAFGFTVPTDVQGNLRLLDFMSLLNKELEGLDKVSRMSTLADIFNLRGQRAAGPIATPEAIAEVIRFTAEIGEAGNEARLAAEIMDSGLGGAVRRAISAFEDLNITLGKMMDQYLTPMLRTLPSIVRFVDQLALSYSNLTLALLATPPILLGGGLGLIGLSLALRRLADVIGLVRGAWSGLMGAVSTGILGKSVSALHGAATRPSATKSAALALEAAKQKAATLTGKRQAAAIKKVAKAEKALEAARSRSIFGRLGQKIEGMPTYSRPSVPPVPPGAIADQAKFNKVMERRMAIQRASIRAESLRTRWAIAGLRTTKMQNAAATRQNSILATLAKRQRTVANLEKELVNVRGAALSADAKFSRAMEQRKGRFMSAAGVPDEAAVANLGKKRAAAQKRVLDMEKQLNAERQRADRMASNRRGRTPIPLVGTEQETRKVQDSIKKRTKAMGALARSQKTLQAATFAPKAKKAAILPQIISGLGRSGRAIKSLGGLALGFGKLAASVGKFVFSFGGITTIIQTLFLFGDRIPIVNTVLARFGQAFGAAFGHIGQIAAKAAPAFALLRRGFELLGDESTKEVGFGAIVDGVSSLASIVGGQLKVAWHGFFATLGNVWDRIKMIVGGAWEIIKLIGEVLITTIGNVLGQSLSFWETKIKQFSSMISGGVEGGGLMSWVDAFAKTTALFIGMAFKWVGEAIIRFTNMFSWFLEEFELMMNRFLVTVVKAIPGASATNAESTIIDRSTEVWKRRNARMEAEKTDLGNIENAHLSFIDNLGNLVMSNTAKTSGAAVKAGLEEVDNVIAGAWDKLRALDAIQPAQPTLQPSPGAPSVPDFVPPAEEIQKIRRGFAAALIGSAASTRGNVTRAVTEEELKKQSELLKQILEEQKLGNQRAGLVFHK